MKTGADDPRLAVLYFHFGRYLLISCSRPGTMAANLQGLWNDSLAPSWESKYTININTEMNYWPAEVTNLAELHEPLFDLLDRARPDGRRVAKAMYGAGGFVHPPQHRPLGPRGADRRRALRHLADGRRLAQPAPLGPLRLHARPRVPRVARLPDHEGGRGVLPRLPRGRRARAPGHRAVDLAGERLRGRRRVEAGAGAWGRTWTPRSSTRSSRT